MPSEVAASASSLPGSDTSAKPPRPSMNFAAMRASTSIVAPTIELIAWSP